jgi:NitT/TauT family transport system ATP-binding protein
MSPAVEPSSHARLPRSGDRSGQVQIECEGLAKVFGDGGRGAGAVVALRDVSFHVRAGQFVVLLGPSGCGKSTLLNIIAGFERATRGEIRLDGQPIVGPGPNRGVVFQDYALFPWLTVQQNIEYGLREKGLPRAERLARSRQYVELVGLVGFERRYPHQLSGGMQQRVAISRALAIDPKTLLMDEPFGALDAMTRDVLHDELETLWRQRDLTIVFVTHNVREAARLADRIVVLSSRPGRVTASFDVAIDRPRRIESPEVGDLASQVTAKLREEVRRHAR